MKKCKRTPVTWSCSDAVKRRIPGYEIQFLITLATDLMRLHSEVEKVVFTPTTQIPDVTDNGKTLIIPHSTAKPDIIAKKRCEGNQTTITLVFADELGK